MRLDPDIIRLQIANLIAAHPELAEDDVLRADMIEGATDAHEFLRMVERRRQEAAAFVCGIESAIGDLRLRSARYVRREEVMRELMFKVLQAGNVPKLELPEATLSVRQGTPKVVITDDQLLPHEFVRLIEQPDKISIKLALEKGETVPGAELSNAEPTLAIRVK